MRWFLIGVVPFTLTSKLHTVANPGMEKRGTHLFCVMSSLSAATVVSSTTAVAFAFDEEKTASAGRKTKLDCGLNFCCETSNAANQTDRRRVATSGIAMRKQLYDSLSTRLGDPPSPLSH
ncbi:hypothetical protein EVAR_17917_1 [Eumeta japonica]|uniref:Uncharacterized protein n=1 Tax=Eumeta variegata TaxID=151549 RepID=A0A4C1UY93_EUMVA|nr:hypothetical protein EVAR_17917_1 [Eumeta japonica]